MQNSQSDTGLPIIEFSDFSFKYRAQQEPTLQHINLKVRKGEKILITGPSGCGKSTIVHCINGLIPEALPGEMSGKLSVCGLSPEDAGIFGMSRHVGTVLQDTDGQFIGLTVAEDLAFSLENDNQPQEELFRKVDEVAHIVGMEHFLKHAPSELSGGQKQRVSMGGVNHLHDIEQNHLSLREAAIAYSELSGKCADCDSDYGFREYPAPPDRSVVE